MYILINKSALNEIEINSTFEQTRECAQLYRKHQQRNTEIVLLDCNPESVNAMQTLNDTLQHVNLYNIHSLIYSLHSSKYQNPKSK